MPVLGEVGTATATAGGTFSIQDYGAKCDVIAGFDGTVTSGSAILTSPSAAFTAADVGKLIWVNGDMHTIASRQSATQVTLNANMGYSQAGGIPYAYGTDDTAAITSTLAALPAHGGVVLVPGLTFDTASRDLRQRAGLTFRGVGGKVGNDVLRGGQFTNGNIAVAASGLIYTGSAAYYLKFTDSINVNLERLGVFYCATAFTGDLVIMGGSNGTTPGYLFNITECTCGSLAAPPAIIRTAYSVLNLAGTVLFTSRDTTYGGAQNVIVGLDPNAASKSLAGFSNAVNFYGGQIIDGSSTLVLNPGTSWNFNGVVFEPGQIKCSADANSVTFASCGFWDIITSASAWIITGGQNITIRDCYIENGGANNISIDCSQVSTAGLVVEGTQFDGYASLSGLVSLKVPTNGGAVFLTGLWFKANTFIRGATNPTSTFSGNANVTVAT